jgi:hypothetical protein
MNVYELGQDAYRTGKKAHCPYGWPSQERREWYDGYYDAMLGERYDWWYAERWHPRNRIEEDKITSPKG